MKRHGLSPKWVYTTQFAASVLLFHVVVQAQTIESQDTRTFQDSRAQDGRQSPTVIPPDETERLKQLTEKAILPEDPERSAPSEALGNRKREPESPQRHMPADKRE